MSEAFERNVLSTYRTLRVAMVPLLLILVVATALESIRGQDCLLGSISAYFYTPARGAFVLSLAALGACMIVYKGNDAVEDVLLNFAGFMALIVALVPTTVDANCPTKYVNVVADANTADAVRNNVLTLLIVSVVFLLLLYGFMPRQVERAKARKRIEAPTPFSEKDPAASGMLRQELQRLRDPKSTLAKIVGLVAVLVVLVEMAMFVFWPGTFKDRAHGISAGTLVLGVLGVMVANANSFERATRERDGQPAKRLKNRYGVTAAATFAMIVVAIVIFHNGSHLILMVEVVVLVGFIVFWYIQARELWFYPTREQKSDAVDRVLGQAAAPTQAMQPGRPTVTGVAPVTAESGPAQNMGPEQSTVRIENLASAESTAAQCLKRGEVYKAL